MKETKKFILSKEIAQKKMRRMAYEILEHNLEEKEIIFAGIHESGSVVAGNIQRMFAEISSIKTELITLSLDKKNPKEVMISKPMDFSGKVIIVIDDVSMSGKTLLYALKPFLDFYPKKIQTLVLVERSHTNFPVRPDYVGLSIASTLQEHIYVEVEGNEITGAYLQ